MPLTPAHPAAAIPFRRLLGRHAVLSALVIGSMTPDLNYFRPFALLGMDSHSLEGFIPFCVPFGVLWYWLFQLILKRPLLSLMPPWVASRVGGLPSARRLLPSVSPVAVVASIVIGAATHVGWDACTHWGGGVVRLFPVLLTPIATVSGHTIGVYKVIGYLSTIFGTSLVALWAWRWLRDATPGEPAVAVLPLRVRIAILASIPGVGVIAGLWTLARSEWFEASLGHYVYRTGLSVLSASAVWGVAVCLAWHFVSVVRRRPEAA